MECGSGIEIVGSRHGARLGYFLAALLVFYIKNWSSLRRAEAQKFQLHP